MKKYALIGRNINYSFSPILHKKIFEKYKIDGSYEIINLPEEEIESFLENMREGSFQGINVTIPYKEKIMKYLDHISPEAMEIGAVNTVTMKNGKLYGYNTDYFGFLETIKKLKLNCKNKKTFILGNGGASKTVAKVLKDLEARVTIVSRNPKGDGVISYEEFAKKKGYLIVNGTPLGTFPNIDQCPVTAEILGNFDFAIDLIYNPRVTKFLSLSKQGANGFYMLVAQGVKAQELWQNMPMALDEIYEELENL